MQRYLKSKYYNTSMESPIQMVVRKEEVFLLPLLLLYLALPSQPLEAAIHL